MVERVMSNPRSAIIYKSTGGDVHGNHDGWWYGSNEFEEDDIVFFSELLWVGPFETVEEANAVSCLFQNTGFETSAIPEFMTADLTGIAAPPVSVDLDALIHNRCVDDPSQDPKKLMERYEVDLEYFRDSKA
jgi:hypothetical protein